jgi:hypothetical protein
VAWTSAYAQLFTDQLLYWQDRIDDSILKASMASNRHDAGQLLSEDARFDSFIHMLEYLERSSNPPNYMRALITASGKPSPNNYVARKGPWSAYYDVDHVKSSYIGLEVEYHWVATSLMNKYSNSTPPCAKPWALNRCQSGGFFELYFSYP